MDPDTTMTTPAYQVAAPSNPPQGKKHLVLIGTIVSILVLIALGCAAYFFVPAIQNPIRSGIAATHVPGDLTQVLFIGVTGSKNTYYQAKGFGFETVQTPTFDSSTALSPNGSVLADVDSDPVNGRVTNRTLGPSPVDPDQFRIVLKSKDGTSVPVAKGYAPAFLDDTHLAYFSKSGFVVHDTARGTSVLLFRFATSTKISQVQYSHDRTHLIWTNTESGETILAAISPTAYKPLHAFVDLISPVLGDTALYDVRYLAIPDGTQLLAYPFDGGAPVVVLTIPAYMNIRSMIR